MRVTQESIVKKFFSLEETIKRNLSDESYYLKLYQFFLNSNSIDVSRDFDSVKAEMVLLDNRRLKLVRAFLSQFTGVANDFTGKMKDVTVAYMQDRGVAKNIEVITGVVRGTVAVYIKRFSESIYADYGRVDGITVYDLISEVDYTDENYGEDLAKLWVFITSKIKERQLVSKVDNSFAFGEKYKVKPKKGEFTVGNCMSELRFLKRIYSPSLEEDFSRLDKEMLAHVLYLFSQGNELSAELETYFNVPFLGVDGLLENIDRLSNSEK